VEVQAESLYEAAVLAMSSFRQHDCPLGPASQLEIRVTSPSVTHTVTVKKVGDWLDGGARSPKEKLAKERLRGLVR
jgi:hypothetical protein